MMPEHEVTPHECGGTSAVPHGRQQSAHPVLIMDCAEPLQVRNQGAAAEQTCTLLVRSISCPVEVGAAEPSVQPEPENATGSHAPSHKNGQRTLGRPPVQPRGQPGALRAPQADTLHVGPVTLSPEEIMRSIKTIAGAAGDRQPGVIDFTRTLQVKGHTGHPDLHYHVLETLGRGSCGVVSKVQCKETQRFRCMKVVGRHTASSMAGSSMLNQEIETLKTLDHPSLVRLYEHFSDSNGVYLILDLFSAGTLLEVFEKKCVALCPPQERWVCDVFSQVSQGIAYAHGKGVMHKDLKLDNIMLCSESPPQAVVIDMGFSEAFPVGSETHCSTMGAGTVSTMAPEVIKQMFSFKCDVWSLGCCLFGLLAKRPTLFRKPGGTHELSPYPFLPPVTRSKPEMEAFMDLQRKGPKWDNFNGSGGARDVVEKMLTFDPAARPCMGFVLDHAWFNEYGPRRLITDVSGLLHYHSMTALEQKALMDAASQLPVERLRLSMELFAAMDRDHDGRLNAQELTEGIIGAGHDAVKACDAARELTSSGPLEFSQFVAALLWSQWNALNVGCGGVSSRVALPPGPAADTIVTSV